MADLLKNYLKGFKNKNILIHGLGVNGGGLGSALFFLENGFEITITDLKTRNELARSINQLISFENKINYKLGSHDENDFKHADIIIKGPGISPENKYIKTARSNGAKIISDMEIFFNITPCNVYGLTGSKGKSTTVSIIYNIFKQESENSFLGGNITISPLSFYKKLDKNSLLILELSSWQLRDLQNKKFRFNGCGITNLLNDHGNYYKSMTDYLNDKSVIVQNQTKEDFCLLPYNDKLLNAHNIKTNAKIYYFSLNNPNADFYFKDKTACFNNGIDTKILFNIDDVKIPGEHNRLNMLLAAGFSLLSGINKEAIIAGIKNFKGTPYRMEFLREWNGIKFYNDTTATIPDAAINALKAFNEPVIWIAGGNDKNLDFSGIKDVAGIPKKIFLLTGCGTDKMIKFLNPATYVVSDSLDFLFKKAVESAKPGDIVLLSPGCTSFGLFQNEFHRGDVFNDLVKRL